MRPQSPKKDTYAPLAAATNGNLAGTKSIIPHLATAAIIIHWGDTAPTIRLVLQLSRLTGIDQIIVVANDAKSCPVAIAQLALWVVPPRNLGFAGGFDLGARAAEGADYYLLLNNDVSIDDECVTECQAALADPSIGIVAPVLVNDTGLQSAVGRMNRPFYIGAVRNRPNAVRVCDAEWVTGAVMFIRAVCYAQVRFDLSYFLAWEDTDLCFRFRREGWRIVIASRAQAWHEGGATIPSAWSSYFYLRNRIWFTRRWGTRPEVVLVWLWGGVLVTRVLVADILKRRNLSHTRSSCHALMDGLKQLPSGQIVAEAEPRPTAWGVSP